MSKLKRKGVYAYERIAENPDTMERQWHQNHSALVVPKCAEAALVHGQDIADFIYNHADIFDFMLRTKVGRADKLVLTHTTCFIEDTEIELQKITRYYISNNGGALTKISPPTKGHDVGQWKRSNKLTDEFYRGVLAELRGVDHSSRLPHELDATGLPWDERINTKSKTKYGIRRTSVNAGFLVTPCNNINDILVPPDGGGGMDINFEYYIAEVEKLVNPLRGV